MEIEMIIEFLKWLIPLIMILCIIIIAVLLREAYMLQKSIYKDQSKIEYEAYLKGLNLTKIDLGEKISDLTNKQKAYRSKHGIFERSIEFDGQKRGFEKALREINRQCFI
ncbi:MAG: hypothetical protein KAI57_03400 [Candidatus Pacebacteria bacterium]|nr:hypothetical protein [Candidatus Paceibacterota bacterium]